MSEEIGVEGSKVREEASVCGGRHEPFGGYIVEVLDDCVDSNSGARPAEAVDQPGRHCEALGWVGSRLGFIARIPPELR